MIQIGLFLKCANVTTMATVKLDPSISSDHHHYRYPLVSSSISDTLWPLTPKSAAPISSLTPARPLSRLCRHANQ